MHDDMKGLLIKSLQKKIKQKFQFRQNEMRLR